MLESIFICVFLSALGLSILAVERESVVYSAFSILLWIITMAGQLYIEVPGSGVEYYAEPAFFAVALGFIFFNAIWSVVIFFDFRRWRNTRVGPRE